MRASIFFVISPPNSAATTPVPRKPRWLTCTTPRATAKTQISNSMLRSILVFFAAATLAWAAPATPASPADAEITDLLTMQAAAWNRGDLDAFMDTYARTDGLRFASADHVTYGWQATRDRYHTRYPDRAAMGRLTFSDLTVTRLADDAAIVFGRWHLARAHDTPHGLFTLTVRKTPAGWRIFQDHTSAAAEH